MTPTMIATFQAFTNEGWKHYRQPITALLYDREADNMHFLSICDGNQWHDFPLTRHIIVEPIK